MNIIPKCCILCDLYFETKTNKYLCEVCFNQLFFIKRQEHVSSLLYYNSTCRALILNSKIRQNLAAIECLIELMIQSTRNKKILQQMDFIMPAPCSVFSRAFGRFDLAWILAKRLSNLYKIKFIHPPWTLYWNLKKSSFNKKAPYLNFKKFLLSKQTAPSLIIIDDIITSGKTLYKVANSLGTHYKIHFLTIACARSTNQRTI